ncbi:flagellar hook-length control protein FliK, partial [Alsobacter sp. SYSU M60028]
AAEPLWGGRPRPSPEVLDDLLVWAAIGLAVAQSSSAGSLGPGPTPAPGESPTPAPSAANAEAVSHPDERRKAAPAEPAAPGGQTFTARVFELPPATPGAPRVEAADAAQPGPAAPAPPATPVAMVPIEIGMRALEGARQFQIRLHPEEYGRVDVKLDLDGDGRVKAHLVVDRVETLALLQRDARTLERAFEQAGLKTGDGALQFSLGQQGQQGQQGQPHHPDAARRAFARPDLRAEPSPEARLNAALRGVRVGASGLDISI